MQHMFLHQLPLFFPLSSSFLIFPHLSSSFLIFPLLSSSFLFFPLLSSSPPFLSFFPQRYAKRLRDRNLKTGPSYLFDDLIPPTEQVTVMRRQPYEELAANRFTQAIFLLTQRLPHMLTSLTSVLGYLAAVPEGGGIVGKRCMATLTHMSTGGLQYERAVLKSISRCVTSQLFMFDRPVTKEEEEEVDEEEVIDERHDTLIAGISGFVAMTGHAEILHPVVNVVGGWVATVAKEWTTAKDPLTQDFVWKSGELLKYMRLTTAACTFRKTSLNFGSQLKMMKTLHELWDPNPDIEAQGTGWFGLRHLGHHIDVKDKRLSSRKMKRMIGKVQKATIELFQRLCKHGYALTHTEAMMAAATTDTDTDDESKSGYRSPGDIVYVIDKTANTWPAYVRCIVVRCVGTRGGGGMGDGTDADNDNDDDDDDERKDQRKDNYDVKDYDVDEDDENSGESSDDAGGSDEKEEEEEEEEEKEVLTAEELNIVK